VPDDEQAKPAPDRIDLLDQLGIDADPLER
jgi:hypothetical protein